MKKLKNKLMFLVVILCFSLSGVFADVTDCSKFGVMYYKQDNGQNGFKVVDQAWETSSNEYSDFLSISQQKKIIGKDDLNTAMLNLKKYCCEEEIISGETCEQDKVFFNSNALDSKYLFDHILDVMARRMNGLKSENDIYVQTKMDVDEKGTERRDWINDKAEDLEGSDAQSIMDAYKNYWTKSDPRLGYDISNEINGTFVLDDQRFLRYVSGKDGGENLEESKKVAESIKNYDNWTLYDRYNNMCAMAKYFYSLLNYDGSKNSDRNKIISILSDGSCEDIMHAQIDNENKYVQLVMQRSSNLFEENYIEGYFKYLYDRGNKLISLMDDINARFMNVIRAIPHLVNTTVKG